MSKQKLILDLDGTVTDPKLGILRSFHYALKTCGFEGIDESEKYHWLIGPPLRDGFVQLLHGKNDPAVIERLVLAYRERYSPIGIFENSLYPGIFELIQELAKERKLYLATSKPTEYAKRILQHYDIAKFFESAVGCEFDGRRSTKEEIIKYAIESSVVDSLSQYLMIGDRLHDILGAKAVGIDSIGVLYGYGTKEEMLRAAPNYLVGTVKDLGDLLRAL